MVESYFALEQRHTTVKIEIVAGLTTFLTMAYVIFVNPLILSETGMDHQALIAVTCIVTAIATIIVGIVAKAPIAMAPGMGLNAFFAYLVSTGRIKQIKPAMWIITILSVLFLTLDQLAELLGRLTLVK